MGSGAGNQVARRGPAHELLRRLNQSVFNRFALLLAGGPRAPYAVLRHRGRISGREHRIPVVARRSGRWFVIPLPYGEDVNWCKNVLAAGGCTIDWRGATYTASDPRVVGLEVVGPGLPRLLRSVLTLTGTRRYLILRTPARPEG